MPVLGIIVIAGLVSCRIFKHNHYALSNNSIPKFSIRVTGDSVYVDGAIRYSNTLVLPRFDKQLKHSNANDGRTIEWRYTGAEMVQGRDSVIHDAPVCLKDVDFDGEYELCFRRPGWNRHYFEVYKIVSPIKAQLMTGHPFNNIVYSELESCNTVFDYQRKTIRVTEVQGSQSADHLYGRRKVVTDVLDPLEHIKGVETSHGGGFDEEDTFEKGQWVRSERTFDLDDNDYQIKADYELVRDSIVGLKRLWYRNRFNDEGWSLFYEEAAPDGILVLP